MDNDGDGIPDFQDDDSDNDGIPTQSRLSPIQTWMGSQTLT